jgi:hypothetical protein
MMNSGEPITGIDRRPLNKAGMDIREIPLCGKPIIDHQDARRHAIKANQPAAIRARRAAV